MNRTFSVSIIFLTTLSSLTFAEDKKVRLFILSGQSNMARLKPEISFTPAVTEDFSDDECIVVKNAQGGQPIRRWFKDWKPADGSELKNPNGDLYDALMKDVKEATKGKKLETVSFVWMQGERDSKEGNHTVYEKSLNGLVDQFRADMKCPDMTVVIGRLSDARINDEGWVAIRKAQEKVAADDPLVEWVENDDLNGDNDGVHYTPEGYKELGKRFADKTIELLK